MVKRILHFAEQQRKRTADAALSQPAPLYLIGRASSHLAGLFHAGGDKIVSMTFDETRLRRAATISVALFVALIIANFGHWMMYGLSPDLNAVYLITDGFVILIGGIIGYATAGAR